MRRLAFFARWFLVGAIADLAFQGGFQQVGQLLVAVAAVMGGWTSVRFVLRQQVRRWEAELAWRLGITRTGPGTLAGSVASVGLALTRENGGWRVEVRGLPPQLSLGRRGDQGGPGRDRTGDDEFDLAVRFDGGDAVIALFDAATRGAVRNRLTYFQSISIEDRVLTAFLKQDTPDPNALKLEVAALIRLANRLSEPIDVTTALCRLSEEDSNAGVRRKALRAVVDHLGKAGANALLVRGLKDSSMRVRVAAAAALEQSQMLAAIAANPEVEDRARLEAMRVRFDGADERWAIPLLKSEAAPVAAEAAVLLGEIGTVPVALPPLREAQRRPEIARVVTSAISVLLTRFPHADQGQLTVVDASREGALSTVQEAGRLPWRSLRGRLPWRGLWAPLPLPEGNSLLLLRGPRSQAQG